MHLSLAFLGRGTLGLPRGNQLNLKKCTPQYLGLSGLLGLFLARGLGTYRWLPLSPFVSLCLPLSPFVSLCLPLSHCLSDIPRVETLLLDYARRFGELSNVNVESCDSYRYPWGPPSWESRWQVHNKEQCCKS